MKRPPWHLLVVGAVLNCLGFVLSALWTAEQGYVIQSIGVVVWLNILLVLGATYGRRWTVYVLAGVSLVSGVAQGATLEPRRFIVSALELGAAAACIAYLAQTRSDQNAGPELVLRFSQHPDEHGFGASGPPRSRSRVPRRSASPGGRGRGDARLVALGDEFDSMDGNAALRCLSASGEFRPPDPDPPERVVIELRLPGPDDPHTD